ncbi:ABC transporter ATP-binding protein [Candidatus Phytoplasma pini]|uniref:Multidrug resistance ABC transporter ATP-binding and permease protein n=1 Tax=Candidatus Phytoplasma pini TaxID=267362 RepID=A0A559KJZ8_9MOLU|nr:ABC transporter ATP-binding protein [Candidatus Phytoplasma pini]TVY12418.1 multidrug resistance ABC transporter ATP-binding and permease protein [Candidatus Phytoplasma pini]
MKLILRYLKKYKMLFFLNLISVIFIICGEVLISFFIGKFILNQEPNNNIQFSKIVIYLIFLLVLGILGNLIMSYCSAKLSSLIFKDLSIDLFQKIQTFSLEDIQKLGISNIMHRSVFNVYQIMSFVSSFYRTAIVAPITLVVSLILMFFISPYLSCSVFFIVPLFLVILFFIMKKNYRLSLKQQEKLESMNSIIRTSIKGVKTIRIFNQEKNEEKKFNKINLNYNNLIIKLFLSVFSIEPIFYLLVNVSVILTIGLGVSMLKPVKNINIGDLYNCINLQYNILFSILNLLLLFTMLPKTSIAIKKIQDLLNIAPAIKNNFNLQKLAFLDKKPLDKIKTLEFKKVFFRYSNLSHYTLEDINFKVRSSEIIAFIGSTGAGKTTLISLIPRLMDPTHGIIEINENNILNYDLKELRNKISFVSQKNILFKGTILSNLLFSKEDATPNQILEKSKIAQSYEFIQNKEHHLNEPISELGSNLSGGQKQRLSITRALLKKPDVYIFDDSFSALDYQTDLAIRKAFFSSIKDVIVIIVAQRLSSVLNSDKIVVLDRGKIVDIGNHKELIQRCFIYQKICLSQKIKEVV